MNVPVNAKWLRASLPRSSNARARARASRSSTGAGRLFRLFRSTNQNTRPSCWRTTRCIARRLSGIQTMDKRPRITIPSCTDDEGAVCRRGGLDGCADSADPAHIRCCGARDGALEACQTLVTTDFVVDETLTLIRFRLGLRAAETWWQQVDRSPRLRRERIDSDRFEKSRDLFFQYRDKDFSFTECTSFVTIREIRLTHTITTDRHFRQMGFHILPGPRGRAPRK